MARTLPAQIQDPFEKLPAGLLGFQIGQGYEGVVGQQPQVLAFVFPMTVIEPSDSKYYGQDHTQSFWIGNDKDPMAEEEATMEYGCRRMKKMFESLGYAIEGQDLDALFNAARDQQVAGSVSWSVIPEMNREGIKNDRAGMISSRVDKWMSFQDASGHFHIDEGAMEKAQDRSAASQPAARPGPTVRPGPAARPGPAGRPSVQQSAPTAQQPLPSQEPPPVAQPAPPAARGPTPRPIPGAKRLGAK